MVRVRVKICCILNLAEARTAIVEGAAAVGLVSRMPSGPGVIDDDKIRAIAAVIPPGVASFLLTAETDPDRIVAQQRATGVDTIQLVNRMPAASRAVISKALPGIGLVQVIHVEDELALEQAREATETSNALLLDSGRPGAQTPELGGTGRVHNWEISAGIVEAAPVPVWLAGGLSPGNVAAAIDSVKPFGVDVCTGLRTEGGQLDRDKLVAFIRAVDKAASHLAEV